MVLIMELILTKLQCGVHLPEATLPQCWEFYRILKQVRLLHLKKDKKHQGKFRQL